ncbi:hypothetical protein NX059_011250 [Plenodomus lindquistii]|nr:hypothetical protein NX059_011250 [Plenodomus lindquistii]
MARLKEAANPAEQRVLGASLLNNARMAQTHGSPTGAAANSRPGQLKRPSRPAKTSQRQLARRGDTFQVPLSPDHEALPSSPPATAATIKRPNPRPRNEPRVEIPVRSHTKLQTRDAAEPSLAAPTDTKQNGQAPSRKRISSEGQSNTAKKQKTTLAPDPSAQDAIEQGSSLSDHSDTRESSSSTDDAQIARPHPSGPIAPVFDFLDRERRTGSCQTEHASTIRRLCRESCNELKQDGATFDTVKETSDAIRKAITQMLREVQEHERLTFKIDAFSHLFRALISYLKVIYNWLDASEHDITHSLHAMGILTTFMRAVLSFKDQMDQWRVSVPQRFKGDRVIKDVESCLVAPLRKVYKWYDSRLGQLQAAEERLQENQKLRRRLRQEEDQRYQDAETAARRRHRQLRWQELHIARMGCEPEWHRRPKLRLISLEEMEERDANGFRFERVPVFTTRSNPPTHTAVEHLEERTWTDDETTALLEAVQHYSGRTFD